MEENNKNIYYHYTSLEALDSIIKTGKFRLTNLKYTNDLTELKFNQNNIIKVLYVLLEKNNSNKEKYIYKSLIEAYKSNDFLDNTIIDPYAISLTMDENNLYHWRCYANGGKGVNIGFDINKLIENTTLNENNLKLFLFSSICYDIQSQAQLVKNMILNYISSYKENYKNADYNLLALIIFNNIRIFCKIEDFDIEKEYRLSVEPNNKLVEFLLGEIEFKKFIDFQSKYISEEKKGIIHGEIMPFIELNIKELLKDGLFSEIWIGPLSSLSEEDLKNYLKPYGINAKIEKSKIPLRF